MTHFPRVRLVVSLGLVLSACNTEEIAPHQVAIETTQTDPGQGAFLILFAPTDATFAAEQARASTNPNSSEYHLFVDGREVVFDNAGSPVPVVVLEGDEASGGYLNAGMHHLELAAPGAPAVFSGDGPIVTGAVNRLYLFGPLDALQSRFVSYPFTPPAGSEHASVINLVRGGGSIEVLSCADASHCTPASPPLALGETFDGDFPFVPSDSEWSSLSSGGAGLGYRLLPTPSLPAPPIRPLRRADLLLGHSASALTPAPDFVGAPIYMSSEGQIFAEWN